MTRQTHVAVAETEETQQAIITPPTRRQRRPAAVATALVASLAAAVALAQAPDVATDAPAADEAAVAPQPAGAAIAQAPGGAAPQGGAQPPSAPPGGSQPPPTPPPDVVFKVTEAPSGAHLINVPVNQGVLVDFNVPLREVRIANPAIAEVAASSPKQIVVTGKSFGTTQLIVWVDGDTQRVFNVAVDLDLERLAASIRAAVPRAQVRAQALMNNVLLTGNVPDADAAERIMQIAAVYSPNVINHMKVAGVQQVLLRVTVAEVNKSATRQLGFNGWAAGDNFHDMFAVNQLDGINPVNIGGAAEFGPIGGPLATRLPFATDRQEGLPLRPRSTMSFGFPRLQMQVFVQALRENGLLRVLAEPNLIAISGEKANFLAGGEFPIPVPQRDSVTIDFREFGVRLDFTPVVVSQGLIRLKVTPEVSEPDFSTAVTISGFVVPGLSQRRVDTTVELGAGQTFAIGGLLSQKVRAVSKKVPALGDVPILGALFSSVEYQQDESELVVLVTPELVEPLNPDQIAYVPGADMTHPNDFELFALGQLQGAESGKGKPVRNSQSWPVKPGELYGPPAAMKLRGPIGPAGGDEGL